MVGGRAVNSVNGSAMHGGHAVFLAVYIAVLMQVSMVMGPGEG